MRSFSLCELKNEIHYQMIKAVYHKNLRSEKEYWSRQKKNINMTGKDYYVIRRKDKAGLFSFYITTVAQIKRALDRGLIPVVDLMNYRNVYMGLADIGQYNPWEILFSQPSDEKLTDIEKTAKSLYYCDIEVPEDRPNDEMDFLNTLNKQNNIWREIVSKYVKVDQKILEDADEIYQSISNNGRRRILGVLCRGTDYISLKPKNHPVQPSLEELFETVDAVKKKYDCESIFLATEDSIYENAFKQKYGDLLCTIQEEKILYTGGYLSDIIRLQTKQERMQTAVNYLKKILVLSKCQCFVAGRTSGTVGVMLQDHQFDCTFFFDHGRY